ncbi:MAG: flagellin, partial [Gammaproteobacteria bacterium]|nr:flagellin [Gammaproteobacteria bacterium]
MTQVINTNALSLNAQRNLMNTSGQLGVSLQRLSSGLRINSAKDDAAGLAISERFTTQIRGLNQAIRNANDGISLSQTGEGALQELTNNLQRIRELAVQSANATNSASDRAALDREVQQRLAEVDRIASQTSFNGQRILDGTFGDAAFQVGANVGESISLSLNTSMRQSDIGEVAKATSVDLGTLITPPGTPEPGVAAVFTSGEITHLASFLTTSFTVLAPGGEERTITLGGGSFGSAANLATQIDAQSEGDFAVSEVGGNQLVFTSLVDGDGDFTFGGANAGLITSGGEATVTGVAGVSAGAGDPLELGELNIQIGDREPAAVAAGQYATVDSFLAAVNAVLGTSATATVNSSTNTLSIVSAETITISGDDAATVFVDTEFTPDGSLSTVSVATLGAANDTIQRVDSALNSVSDLRSTFGAIQNRFESTIANLSSVVENLSASRSRI